MPTEIPKQAEHISQVLGSLETAVNASMAAYSLGVGARRGLVQAIYGPSHPFAQAAVSWSEAAFPLICHAALAPWYGGLGLLKAAYLPLENPSKVD